MPTRQDPAGIGRDLFGGGFPRDEDPECRRAAQRAIFHVQKQLEATGEAHRPAIVLCDRGTVDGIAYWPGPPAEFWTSTATTMDAELGRYDAVLHLRTPTADQVTTTRTRCGPSRRSVRPMSTPHP